MEEQVKTLRTLKEFINWRETIREDGKVELHTLNAKLDEFYIKFKYILEQEAKEIEDLIKFLG